MDEPVGHVADMIVVLALKSLVTDPWRAVAVHRPRRGIGCDGAARGENRQRGTKTMTGHEQRPCFGSRTECGLQGLCDRVGVERRLKAAVRIGLRIDAELA